MSILWNEFSALYRRKQFLLLSAVLFIFGLAALFLYERNTEEYYYLFQEKEGTAEWYEAREAASEAYLSEYEIFLTGMEGRAEQIRNSGFLQTEKQRQYQEKELKKTWEADQKLYDIRPVKGDFTAAKKYSSWPVGILFELVFLVTLLYFCFYEDKDQNRYVLFRATAKGRGRLGTAKLVVMLLSVLGFTVLFELMELTLLSVLYGAGDLSVPLSSLPAFRNTTHPITIREMILLAVCMKVLVLWMITGLLYALSTVFGKISLPVLILMGVTGIELILWFIVSPTSSLRGLHYLNLYSFVNPSESLGSYVLLNFGGTPVQTVQITVSIITVLLVVFSSSAVLVFSRVNQVRKETFIEKLMLKLRKILHVLQEGSSLFLLELYKVLIQQKKLLILLALLLYFGSLIRSSLLPQMFAQAEEAAYQFYAQRLQGPVGERQEEFIIEEEKRLEGIREEIASLEKESSKDNEWEIRIKKQELDLYEPGFEKVQFQMMMLSMQDTQEEYPHKDTIHYFLNEQEYRNYLTDYKTRLFSWLIAAVGLISLCGGFFTPDARAGMDRLIQTTVNGRRKLSRIRVMITMFFALLLYLGIEIPDLIRYARIDGFLCFSAPFSDLVGHGITSSLPIGIGFLLVSAARFLILIGFGAAALHLSRSLKNEMVSTVILGGGAVLIVVLGLILRMDLWGLLLRICGIHFV